MSRRGPLTAGGGALRTHGGKIFGVKKIAKGNTKTRPRARPGRGRETARDRRAHWRPT
nr:MAG TPA: hypothetical protein [Caudoviricetes sp.]